MSDHVIRGSARVEDAARATAGLLGRLRLDWAFVGDLAFSAWSGEPVESGSIDVLAILSPDRMQQIPMMASNGGFQVDSEMVEGARELDLIPMAWPAGDPDPVRIHVLVASNALYSLMVRNAVDAKLAESEARVLNREDLALLLAVDDRPSARERLDRLTRFEEGFDFDAFDGRLRSIGLASKVVPR